MYLSLFQLQFEMLLYYSPQDHIGIFEHFVDVGGIDDFLQPIEGILIDGGYFNLRLHEVYQ